MASQPSELPVIAAVTDAPPRTIRALDLWGMGVGAVIGGDIFGWQATLAGGFGSGLLALALASGLYLLLTLCVAEIVSIQGTGAGPCQFARACFGHHVAFCTGLAESLKCIVTVGTVVVGISNYVMEILHISRTFAPLCWLVLLVCPPIFNVVAGEASVRTQLVLTLFSIVLLLGFYVGALLRGVDVPEHALGGQSLWETTSWRGIFSSWPFALWFFLGIEELPLAMEVTVDPEKNMPLALNSSFGVLVLLAFATLVLCASVPPGTEGMSKTPYPLLEGYRYVLGHKGHLGCWWLLLVGGLAASLLSFVFATGQLISQMAHDGFFPAWLGRRTRHGTPIAGLFASCACAYATVLALYAATSDIDDLGSVAASMSLFCSLLSYAVQLSCFIYLRSYLPEAVRPFQSPFGNIGALAGLALCLGALVAVLLLPVLQSSIFRAGILLATGALGVCTLLREAVWWRERKRAVRGCAVEDTQSVKASRTQLLPRQVQAHRDRCAATETRRSEA